MLASKVGRQAVPTAGRGGGSIAMHVPLAVAMTYYTEKTARGNVLRLIVSQEQGNAGENGWYTPFAGR